MVSAQNGGAGRGIRRQPQVCRASLQASAIAPILCGAGYAVSCLLCRSCRIAPGKRTEGARDAKGPIGPTGLDTSRHRGLSKPNNRKSAKSQGVPRAVFNRFAPQCPRWWVVRHVQPHFRGHDSPPFQPRHSAGVFRSDAQAYRPSEGLGSRHAARTTAAWTAGRSHRISDASVVPGHRSPPRI
jgi:hypothetical protein